MAPTPEVPAPSSAKRILCVDDDSTIREVLALHLRRKGYDVAIAPDGLTAWHIVSANLGHFDAIVTDNNMPNLDGLSLVARLRGAGYRGKIVFFSSTLAPHAADRLTHLNVDAVVEKGRPVAELTEALHRTIPPH